MKKLQYISLITIILVLGCTKNDEVTNQSVMSFGFSVTEDTTQTRGTILSGSTFQTNYATAGFGVFGFQGNSLILGGASSGSKVTFDNTANIWKSESPFSWVVGNAMSFFAYAPYTIGTAEAITAVSSNGGSPTVSYTVSSDIASQVDLLVAKNINLARPSNGIIPLNFTHPLAAIVFKTGSKFEAGSEIISISLKNVATSGVYNISTGSWTSTSGSESYTLTKNQVYQPSTVISSSNEVMFMIPQTFSDETATLEVVYVSVADPNKRHTISISLKNTSFTAWKSGKKYIYIISPEERVKYDFSVEDIEDLTYEGVENKTISITSKKHEDGAITNLAWSVQYANSENGPWSDTAPSWISLTGGDVGGNGFLTVSPQNGINPSSITWDSYKATSSNPWNLSSGGQNNNITNTANCYVINGPGWYKLPLVYGNAIKNGSTNASAYTSQAITNPFMSHLGVAISDPYILNNKTEEGGDTNISLQATTPASIVWQDVNNMVTNVSVTGSGAAGTFLTFEVSSSVFSSSFRGGNSVLAIKDSNGEIAWSWHIWVTDYKPGIGGNGDKAYTSSGAPIVTPQTSFDYSDGRTRTFMPCNLGWVSDGIVTYNERSCYVKFIQSVTNNSAIKRIFSPAAEISTGNGTFYQHGRKDPFPGTDTVYPSNGFSKKNEGSKTYSETHKNPSTFYTDDNRSWCSTQYSNSWNASLTDNLSDKDKAMVKTIYDPCPTGYIVPNSYALGNLNDETFPWTTEGRMLQEVNLFFPATGYREIGGGNINGNIRHVGSYGFYWSSRGQSTGFCSVYFIRGNSPNTMVSICKAFGNSVRAVREE